MLVSRFFKCPVEGDIETLSPSVKIVHCFHRCEGILSQFVYSTAQNVQKWRHNLSSISVHSWFCLLLGFWVKQDKSPDPNPFYCFTVKTVYNTESSCGVWIVGVMTPHSPAVNSKMFNSNSPHYFNIFVFFFVSLVVFIDWQKEKSQLNESPRSDTEQQISQRTEMSKALRQKISIFLKV